MTSTSLDVDPELHKPALFSVYRWMGRLTRFRAFVRLEATSGSAFFDPRTPTSGSPR